MQRNHIIFLCLILVLVTSVTTVTAREIEDVPPTPTLSPVQRILQSANDRGLDLLPPIDHPGGISYPNPDDRLPPGIDPDHAYLFPCRLADRPECLLTPAPRDSNIH